MVSHFTKDGREMTWHKKPTLTLVERPKRKVKKRFYMMAYIDKDGEWLIGKVPVDENFKDNQGAEFYRCERKIMENSPFIEIEVDE